MSELSDNAWLASEWVKGRKQTEIARELGVTSSWVSLRIGRFCEAFGYRVVHSYCYGDDRIAVAREALMQWGNIPLTRPVIPGRIDYTYQYARHEHAWLLRAEGLTLQQIGDRLGVSRERVREIIYKFSRRVTKAMRRTRFKLEAGT